MEENKETKQVENEQIKNEEAKKEGQNKKRLGVYIVIAVIAIILILIGILFLKFNNKPADELQEQNNPHSNVQINSTSDMENLINTVYEGQETVLPGSLMTQTIDISDVNMLTAFTGLTSNENIDAVVASEPMMSSQAYSFVLVKVKDGADANAIAKEMSEKVDTRKWICVEAEKLYATSIDNLAVLVMSSDEWATPIYNKVKEVLGANNEEYVKENTNNDFTDGALVY